MKEPKAIRYYVSRCMLLWIGISVFLICGRAFAAIPSSERAALIALYNSTNGDNWNSNNGWKTPPLAADGFAMPGTEDSWYGIYCNGSNTTLLGITLFRNNLGGTLPPALGNLGNLIFLDCAKNNISGSIPPQLGSLSNLEELYLQENKLSGRIPSALGNLRNVWILYLNGNRLKGEIPSSLKNLVNIGSYGTLHYSGLSLCWNALYTKNNSLRDFIKEHHDDMCKWEKTQTVAPTWITAYPAGPHAIDLKWEPVSYQEDPGCYRVFYNNSVQGTFMFFAETADKFTETMTVTGLNPSTTYYFKITTRTESHANNRNTLESEFSQVVSASTSADYISITGTITHLGSALPGVTLNLSNNGETVVSGARGYYYARVEQGWSGTVTPAKENFMFSPALRTYAEVSSEQTNQDFTAFITITLHIGAERKTERAFIISRDYGAITLSIENKNNIPGIRCVLERKVNGGIFQPIKEFAGTELSSGAYVYTDKFLDRDKYYSYRLTAYDSEGNHLGSSDEATINNLRQGLLEGGKKNERTRSKEK